MLMVTLVFGYFFPSVIVTEKTNILLRYLHQQWDKKVSMSKVAVHYMYHTIRDGYREPVLVENRFSVRRFLRIVSPSP